MLLSTSPDSIPRERTQHSLRLSIDDVEKNASRTARPAVAALPVSQRPGADGEFGCEFELRQAGLVPDGLHVDVGNAVNPYLHRPPFLVRNGLLEASLDACKRSGHCWLWINRKKCGC